MLPLSVARTVDASKRVASSSSSFAAKKNKYTLLIPAVTVSIAFQSIE